MREILFRGRRTDNAKWVEGYFIEFADRFTGDQQTYIQTVKTDGRLDLTHEVYPATVGQYTGLTDKNGKRIFEGDIIKGNRVKAYAVEYSISIAGFMAKGTGVRSVPCINIGTMKNYEVIGNIHDNPELLEGGIEPDEK